MNIADLLQRAADQRPDGRALMFGETVWRYAELQRAVLVLARWLSDKGIAKGDRVALYLPNIPEFAIAYYAILRCGAIAVSVNSMLTAREVDYILRDSGASAVFASADALARLPADGIDIIVAEGDAGQHTALADLLASGPAEHAMVELGGDDPAAILYTSGTTGFPKGAVLSHANVLGNVQQTIDCTALDHRDRSILFLPLFHCFGQNFILNSAVAAQACVVLHRRFEPDAILQSVQRHRVSVFCGVPTVFIALLQNPQAAAALAHIRYFFTAAASIPAQIAERWRAQFGMPIWEGYGLTETSPFASYNHATHYKPGSIGTPLPGVEMKVVREDGGTAEPGEWGEIAIKGPNVMLGYWNRPRETAQVIRDGWFYSGDIGLCASDGCFEICDRKKDMINCSGFNVYPAEIENELHKHAGVAQVAVFGLPDANKGEVVAAAIVPRDGESIDRRQLLDGARATLAAYKIPRHIFVVTELPKNPTGKILKRVLREQYVSADQPASAESA